MNPPAENANALNERPWQGQRDQDAHDAAVQAVKDHVREPNVYHFAIAHWTAEAVLRVVDEIPARGVS